MTRPTDKATLASAAQAGYERLQSLVDSLPAEQQEAVFGLVSATSSHYDWALKKLRKAVPTWSQSDLPGEGGC